MKEITKIDKVYLKNFDVYVTPYLTYAQIQQIINGVKMMSEWAERQINIDIGILYHATDIGKEKIEEIGHEDLLASGIIDEVKANIRNLNQIYEGIEYTESTARALAQIAKQLPELMKQSIEKVKGNGKSSAK